MTESPDRQEFPHIRQLQTRWMDNDVYGHLNNVEYYSYFDTVINAWLVEEGGLDIANGPTIGVCAESGCRFLAAASFPETIDAGLRVASLGNSSVRYEIGLFRSPGAEPLAAGHFVHVFVDRHTRRPAGIPAPIRQALERLTTG